jgi:hypothetical protein
MTKNHDDKKEAMHDASAQTTEAFPITSEGFFVRRKGKKLIMANAEGKECCHHVAKEATFLCDGVACKFEDLKVGSKIRVTSIKIFRNVATSIEAKA